ncbi:MAG: ABC transporter substrate-binding protein [Chloroflexi bacterium]|nr:ABC transporter substrate-binding protein [Chloroflexota bacterium]
MSVGASSFVKWCGSVLMGVALVACTSANVPATTTTQPGGAGGATTSSQDTLTFVNGSPEGGLDPQFGGTDMEAIATRNIYSSLVKYKPNSTDFTGDLATSWDVSADGLQYTFHLRNDVDWQKGFGHLTANDVKYTLDRVRDPATHSPSAGLYVMIKDVQVLDDYTVRVDLTSAYSAFLHLLTNLRAGSILNQKAVEQYGADYAWNPVGTGPYQFVSYVPNRETVLELNDKYYGSPPSIKRLVIETVPDANAAIAGLETGTYDFLEQTSFYDPATVQRLKDEGYAAPLVNRYSPSVLLMNVTVPPWNDIRVRQAIAYAVDRQQYVDLAYPGMGKPWYSPVPEGYFGSTQDVPHYEHDVARAKELLTQAGYPNGLDMTFNVWDLVTLNSNVLAEQLKQVGIRAQLDVVDTPTFIQHVLNNQGVNFAVECCVNPPDADTILSQWFVAANHSGAYISKYPGVEDQLAAARVEPDATKRQQMYVDIQKKIMDDVAIIPLAMTYTRPIYKASLQGVPSVEPLYGYDLTQFSFQ